MKSDAEQQIVGTKCEMAWCTKYTGELVNRVALLHVAASNFEKARKMSAKYNTIPNTNTKDKKQMMSESNWIAGNGE